VPCSPNKPLLGHGMSELLLNRSLNFAKTVTPNPSIEGMPELVPV
jgi:hypothetical protein